MNEKYFVGQVAHGHHEGFWAVWKQPDDLRCRAIMRSGMFKSRKAAQRICDSLNEIEIGDE